MEGHKPINAQSDGTIDVWETAEEGDQREERKIIDEEVLLSIGKTVIVTDKCKLVQSSPYFASLLRFHADASLNAVSLELPESVHLDTFLAMLHSLTNAEVKVDISATNLWDCIVLSKYIQLEQFEQKCYEALPEIVRTLTMDELLRLWRSVYACAIKPVTAMVMVSISIKMEGASESVEFLDFTVDELVALLSDDGFLPLMEAYVCKAVTAWLRHDSDNREMPLVMERILDKLVWDDWDRSTDGMMQSLLWNHQNLMPKNLPKKRTDTRSNNDETARADKDSIVVGDYTYTFDRSHVFYRTSSVNGERQELALLETDFGSERWWNSGDCKFEMSRVKLADREKIACFASRFRRTVFEEDDDQESEAYTELSNTVALYDIAADDWQYLPCLQSERIEGVMIPCDSFLYIIGGSEEKVGRGPGLVNAHHCYRLDLVKFSARQLQKGSEWERIADLNAPRIEHHAYIEYGRIVVYGGVTETESDNGVQWFGHYNGDPWLEAYDTMLNTWTAFGWYKTDITRSADVGMEF